MSIRWVILLVVALLLAIFVVVNWTAFTVPTNISLLVGTIEAPLGLLMLLILAVMAVIFVTYALFLQTAVMVDTRRMARELEHQRKLADDAEQSRTRDLRASLEARLDELIALQRAATQRSDACAGSQDDALRTLMEQGFNGLAAQIAELDDRLSRTGLPTKQ